MANLGLTPLIPTIYNALDVVSRELVGVIPAVSLDATYSRAALGQTVMSPVVPTMTSSAIVPGLLPPASAPMNIGNIAMTITNSESVNFDWNGEEQLGLDNNGANYDRILRDAFAQAMRTMVNKIENSLASLTVKSSRAWGTPGVSPILGGIGDIAQARKILSDNGAPSTDMQMVLGTTAAANFRSNTQLTKANEAGDTSLLRRGVLNDISGFMIRESGQIKTLASGTGASATTNAAGYAVGATAITLAAVGTGTVLAGDIVTFAGDPNKYGVATGTGAVSGGVINLVAPGLMLALPAAATAMTVLAASTRNMFFARNAIALATRLPALPKGGDNADDRITVTDPLSNLSFDVAVYKAYHQVKYDISLAWGVTVTKPEHMGCLIG